MEDEGRPFEVGHQRPVSNRPSVVMLKRRGWEREGKSRDEPCRCAQEETNVSEPLMTRREEITWHQNWRRTNLPGRIHRVFGFWVGGVRRKGGVNPVAGFHEEPWEPVAFMRREKSK